MITVYCDHITPRHHYIFRFIFEDVMGTEFRFISGIDDFLQDKGPKISYSKENPGGGIHFHPYPILSQNGITTQDTETFLWKGLPVFFKVIKPSEWPFDPFSLAFYLVSRYEEYLPFEPDRHGRFRPEESLAFKGGFLGIPLVDMIVKELKSLISSRYPGYAFPVMPFRFVPTIDVDIAFAHRGKGWLRAAGAWIKLLLRADFRQLKERISVVSGKIPDPYDNFDFHLETAGKSGLSLRYFILIGDFGRYDRNTSYSSSSFKELLKRLSLTADVGIHPSYRSHLRKEIFIKEKKRLEEITGNQVMASRFHFLRVRFSGSFRILIDQGITDDYSLGYSTVNGFRAGTCTPFLFYDIDKEEITKLRIHPFIFMDSAFIDQMKMSPAEATGQIRELVKRVKELGGEAIGIWHNYSLSEKGQYKGWQEVFRTTFKEFQNDNR